MFRVSTLFAIIICLTLSGSPGAEERVGSDQYIIELQVLATSHKVTMDSQSIDTGGDLVTVGDVFAMSIGDIQLDLDSHAIWNGELEPPEDSGIELLTAPRLIVPSGETAELRTGSTVQYLQQKDENCYAVETLPQDQSPGVFMEITVSPGEETGGDVEIVALAFKVTAVVIGERLPLPHTNLDVGKPSSIRSQSFESTSQTKLGRWSVISGHIARGVSEDDEKLIVLVRVLRPPAR